MKRVVILFFISALLLAACQDDPAPIPTEPPATTAADPAAEADPAESATPEVLAEADEPTATAEPGVTRTPIPTNTPTIPTVTPEPPKDLTVCMAIRPSDAYLYGAPSLQAEALHHAIYENLFTTIGFDYQPQGLERIPTLDNGDFRFETVLVERGSIVVDADGEVELLLSGDTVIDAAGNTIVYDEGAVEMTQMVVEFTFKPLVWSDGTPVTADDSVFSFEVAADRFTLSDKRRIERTANYEAVDELTVRWTSIPGHRETLYMENVWPPLPRHVLGGIDPLELTELPEVTQMPLSTGPFVISSWGNDEIVLEPNPHYYRTAEGLPHLDTLRLRFPTELPENTFELVTSGQCDVVTQELIPLDTPDLTAPAAEVALYVQQGVVWEHIAFGINGYGFPVENRPDWFQDPQARQALTMCTDRAKIAEQATFGFATVNDSYIPPEHPLAAGLPELVPYDPDAANAILDGLGYLDQDGDGIREDIETTTPFSITIATTGSDVRVTAANLFAEDLAACGIASTVDVQPAPTFFDINRDGTVFGRNFDAAIFAWVIGTVPTCEHYLSSEITGPEIERFAGWNGANVTGLFNEQFDAACNEALNAFFGTADYAENHTAALNIFAEQRPGIPLFTRPKFMLAVPTLTNVQLETTQPSGLWNIAEWDVEQ